MGANSCAVGSCGPPAAESRAFPKKRFGKLRSWIEMTRCFVRSKRSGGSRGSIDRKAQTDSRSGQRAAYQALKIQICVRNDAERDEARVLIGTMRSDQLSAGDTLEAVTADELGSTRSDELTALMIADRLPATLVDGHIALSGRLPTADELLRSLRDRVTPNSLNGTAPNWPTSRRIHINIDVADVAQSLAFYEVLLDQRATKVREDYAKFELANPPINLALNQVGDARTGVNHMGIEVQASDDVLSARERYRRSGFQLTEELDVVCCYAEQNKIWVADPDGNRWEIVNVVGDAEADEACPPDCICHQEIPPSVVEIAG